MMYRRSSKPFRRYSHSSTNQTSSESISSVPLKVIQQIPLPNEADDIANEHGLSRHKRQPSFLDFITRHIQVEEIIILGLILLLLTEGLEDDILIILLVYIFITGRD